MSISSTHPPSRARVYVRQDCTFRHPLCVCASGWYIPAFTHQFDTFLTLVPLLYGTHVWGVFWRVAPLPRCLWVGGPGRVLPPSSHPIAIVSYKMWYTHLFASAPWRGGRAAEFTASSLTRPTTARHTHRVGVLAVLADTAKKGTTKPVGFLLLTGTPLMRSDDAASI